MLFFFSFQVDATSEFGIQLTLQVAHYALDLIALGFNVENVLLRLQFSGFQLFLFTKC